MSDATTSILEPKQRRARRWLRFSLRTLLLAMLVACVWLGWYVNGVRKQRDSIAAVERLGGWAYYDYEVNPLGQYDPQAKSWAPRWLLDRLGEDFIHPVTVVNMVYNDDSPQRIDNHQNTDEVLGHLYGFPRLQTLLLHQEQASDEGLRHVGKLKRLQRLYIWDGSEVTDAGVAHLAKLRRLEYVHLSNAQIGDDALAVFARLPRVTGLSLQGNRFTDAGLAHLSAMTQLESLWIGLGDTHITDAGLVHLKRLHKLQELDLQHTDVTTQGLRQLSGLKNLKSLYLPDGSSANLHDLQRQAVKE